MHVKCINDYYLCFYTWKLVYQLRTDCPKLLPTSSCTLQTLAQQETVTHCLTFILHVFTDNHITCLPKATLSIDQSNHSPGVLNFQLKLRLSLDSEDGFHTGCRNISRKQQSFSGLQSSQWSFSIEVCYSWVHTIFLFTFFPQQYCCFK